MNDQNMKPMRNPIMFILTITITTIIITMNMDMTQIIIMRKAIIPMKMKGFN